MKKRFTFLIAAIAAILMMAQPGKVMGQTRGTYDKTEGFESASTGTEYQSTVTVSADDSDCGISWEIYYGTVSTSSAISDDNSAALRLYTTDNYGYIKTTSPVYGLSNVACKAKAAETNGAKIKINIDYSVNGSDWVSIEANKELSSSVDDYDWDIPSGGKYFRISISSSSTKPSKKNAQLTIDDIKFTYTGYTVTYDANGGTGTMTDDDSPYGSGATVTVLDNEFTAPASCEFVCWNTQDDGNGTDYYPDDNEHNTFAISTNTTLYAKWNQVSADPSMTVSETALSGFTSVQSSNNPSTSQSFKVSGSNLSSNNITIALNANSDFEISTDNSTFGSSVEPLVPSSGTVAQTTFYVRMKASATSGAKTGSITISCAAIAESSSISLSGTVIPVHTLTYFATNGSIAGVYSGTSTTVASGASVAEGATVSLTASPSDGYRFTGWSDGGDNSTLSSTTTNPTTFTMGNADKTITATFEVDPIVTTYLTGTNMTAMTNAGTSYNTTKSVTTADGFYWETNGYQYAGDNTHDPITNIIQLRKRTNSSGVSYIKLPKFNGKIERIVFSVTDYEATAYTTGSVCKGILGFQIGTTNDESVIKYDGDKNDGRKTITLDLSDVFYNTGYIVVSDGNATRIWNIEVQYLPYSGFTEWDPETPLSFSAGDNIALVDNMSQENVTIPLTAGLVIKTGATLTVGTLTNNGTAANFIIEDGGQLKFTSTGAKADVNATVQKNIAAWTTDPVGNWCFIASPLVGNTDPTDVENMVTPKNGDNYTFDLYRYNDAAANNLAWENYNNTTHTEGFNLVNGQGYLYANVATQTLGFAGVIKPYITTEDANKVAIGPGFNLIGNPYTFSTYINKPYYTLNVGGTTILASEVKNVAINPCAGVIVNGGELGDDIYFTDASQNVASTNNGNLQMVLSQTVATRGENNTVTLDNAIVSFNEGTELEKFYFGNQDANIYIPQNNEQYAIVSSEARGEMPVCFKANRDGQFTINVNPENVEMSYLHLIDNIAGQDIDLIATPSYTFEAKGDDYESRFRLVFSASQNENDNQNEDFAFISNGEIIVNGTGTIQIVDIMGRVVSTKNTEERISTNGMTPGVYVLRLIGNDTKTQKIVVK